MDNIIKIGSRASKLAMWQTNFVAELLQKNGFVTEIVALETKGDKILNAPFAEIGTKGLFTEELEDKLMNGEIDIAVHSAKDMQTDLGNNLELIAYVKREEPNDVLISFDKNFHLSHSSKRELIVGTSSTRRRAILKNIYPNVTAVEARGNLQTRFKKMEEGKFEAMILAYAGVNRMNYNEFIVEKLPLDIFTPAVGQGSIAVESSVAVPLEKRERIRAILNDPETEYCVLAERAFLRKLQGGCSIPVFGLARFINPLEIELHGGIISLDGQKKLEEKINGKVSEAEKIGLELAERIIELGGDKILAEIRK